MRRIRFDFNNMFSRNVGAKDGVTEAELKKMSPAIARAHKHILSILADDKSRISLGLEWARLPYQDEKHIWEIQKIGNEIAARYENVISLGIGGSYLGIKAAQDALCPPYYNDFIGVRRGRPRIYFDGNNLDPDTLSVLLQNLDPARTFVVVISKSGETTETKAAFTVAENWLKSRVGANYGRQVFAITDPESGTLRKKVNEKHRKDGLSFNSLCVMKGVGGRFSELNVGLLHLAIIGVNIQEALDGAAGMYKACSVPELFKNPALMYAALHTVLYRRKGKSIAVMMPFSEALKSTADWYVQLLAESLGKKYGRKIQTANDGREAWGSNKARVVNIGRTPISSRGTNDLHSIQQNNVEGENNKAATFIRVEAFRNEIELKGTGDFLSGKCYSKLLGAAEEATEWALARQKRPNCTVIMPDISPYTWGALIFFFEMATAFEGELLGVNAFDQPGVEGYKNYMYYKLGKAGISKAITEEIRTSPLKKNKKFII